MSAGLPLVRLKAALDGSEARWWILANIGLPKPVLAFKVSQDQIKLLKRLRIGIHGSIMLAAKRDTSRVRALEEARDLPRYDSVD